MTKQAPNIYVLLIGIDYYTPNRWYKSLKGAVRDINLVNTVLEKTLKNQLKRVHRLLSPNPEEPAPTEVKEAQKPTYENIVNTFKTITDEAAPGELVYIHYSGHGGQATTIYPELKQGVDQNDEGIVPMDIGDQEGRYLRDVEITTLLKRMTDKGLVVTVILDSCHSGGATRGDAQIRSSELGVDTTERSAESLVASREELLSNWREQAERGIGVAGLPQAKDYVLLAACRSNEFAYEYPVNGSDRHGALTYWMVDTLTSSATKGQPLTYKLLHDRINAQIQSKFPQQLPMILGESSRLVFGSEIWSTPYTVQVIKVQPEITLNAGMAQGLSKGTQFSIYPLSTTDFTDKTKQVAIVEVTSVAGGGSSARVLQPEEGGIAINGTIESGAPAVMVSAPVDLVQRVRLVVDKEPGNAENQLPPNLVSRQKEALENVRQALAGNGWVLEMKQGEVDRYQLAVGRSGEYEICTQSVIENLRPALSIDDPNAATTVVQRLVHLAKYQAVQSLDNPGSKLAQALEVELLTADEKPFAEPGNPTITTGDIVCLRVKNKGNQPLKVAVLDLEPTWAISQIPLDGLESAFFNLPRGAVQDVKLSLVLPEDGQYQEAKETIKVFAVQNGLADFRWLTLPALDEQPESRGNSLNQQLEGLKGEITRGGEPEDINPLNNLLAAIGADLEQPPLPTTRAARVVTNPKDEWVTQQIQIVVKQ
ncbi:caspase family protein [Phormidium tenue FACHB-886]|nr:caspase family protein [Phormidium tenue FACHB-886]